MTFWAEDSAGNRKGNDFFNPFLSNQIKSENGMIVLFDLSQHFINAAHYWQLPIDNISLKSYGGTLEWTYSYSSRYSSPTTANDVILSDGETQIFYRFDSTGPADRNNKRTLQLIETKWRDELNRPVSRSTFMSLLTKYDSIRVRAVYDKTMHQTAIGHVSLETGFYKTHISLFLK